MGTSKQANCCTDDIREGAHDTLIGRVSAMLSCARMPPSMLPLRAAAAPVLLAVAAAAQGTFSLDRAEPGTLGSNFQFAYAGTTPGLLVLAASFTPGSTPLTPPISNRPLDIGPSLLTFLEPAVGNFGLSTPIAVPNDPGLGGITVHWQAVTLPGTNLLLDQISNRVVTQLATPFSAWALPATSVGRAWAATIQRGAAQGPGTFLFAGGALRPTISSDPTDTSSTFDPRTLEVGVGPPLPEDVYGMVTARIATTGAYLLTGGIGTPPGNPPPPQAVTAGCALYDPVGNTFSATPPMSTPRFVHSAASLPDGRVVVAGGSASVNLAAPLPLASCEVFDPATQTWAPGPSLPLPRVFGVLSTLPNGELLLHGGLEFFGPIPIHATSCLRLVAGAGGQLSWQPQAPISSVHVAHEQGTLLLADGRLLVAGGTEFQVQNGALGLYAINRVDIYDPNTATWSPASAAPSTGFFAGTLTQLPNGLVIAAGGLAGLLSDNASAQPLRDVMAFDPGTGLWQTLPPMQQPRFLHAAVATSDGMVVVVGGHFAAQGGGGNTVVETIRL